MKKFHRAVKAILEAKKWAKEQYNTEISKEEMYYHVVFKLGEIGRALELRRQFNKLK